MLIYRTVSIGLVGVIGVFISAGCVSQGVKAEQDKLALIQPGVTTRAQIEQSFGPPDSVAPVDGHQVLIYSRFKAQGNVLGFLGSQDYERQILQFVLNKDGKVETYSVKEFKGSSGVFDATAKETPVTPGAPAK